MLTITYNTKKLYINIDLLKSHLKNVVITLLKALTFICGFCGAIIMLKSTGLHENNSTTFLQAILRIIQGGFICAIAYILNFIKLVIE